MSSANRRVVRPEPVHQQVARNIRNDIEAGILRDGDVLPSTRELADQWGVSVFTISEAMKLLSAEGLVVSQSRSKRTVRVTDSPNRREVRPQNPRVILIGGYAGSGKTELGRILAREIGWPLFDKDTMTRPIVESALELLELSPNDRESEMYVKLVRPREYEALIGATLENVECGNSAIVTAPFIREFADLTWITRVRATFTALNTSVTFVWVYCNADTMHTYLRHRGAARDTGKLQDWEGYLSAIDLGFRPDAPHVVVDNSAAAEPLQAQARKLLAGLFDQP